MMIKIRINGSLISLTAVDCWLSSNVATWQFNIECAFTGVHKIFYSTFNPAHPFKIKCQNYLPYKLDFLPYKLFIFITSDIHICH